MRGLVAVAAVVLVGLAPSTARAEPTPAEIEKQIDAAWEKLEPLIEQYNKVHSQLQANQRRSADLQQRSRPLQLQVDLALSRVGDIAARQYKLGPASGLNALLSTGSPQTLADQLAMLDHIARETTDQVADVTALRDKYDADRHKIDALVALQKQQDADLAAKKKVIQAEINRLQRLRDRLGTPTASTGSLYAGSCPAVAASGAGGIAIRTACAQIGEPYVWGANGPDSFDCSGLTQYAWKAAGVSLTHYTGAQWNEGIAVSKANLRPGDLVFFYSDLHHVGLYAGNGLIVHASRSGVPVKMARMDGMPYMGARRPG
jgi:cell wall-associated NlpC family hydrolase